MTTIAAVWTSRGAALAGDRRTSTDFGRVDAGAKVRRVSPWLAVGVTGRGGFAPAWLRGLMVPSDVDSLDGAVSVLHDALATWRALPEDGQAHDAVAITPWGVFHLSCDGYVYTLAPSEHAETVLAAVGSGARFARGAMEALLRAPGTRSAIDIATEALRVATICDPGTGDGCDAVTMGAA